MKGFSLTIGGLLLVVILPILIQGLGFTESCAGEIATIAPTLPGLIMAWIGRYRKGDITVAGFKKSA